MEPESLLLAAVEAYFHFTLPAVPKASKVEFASLDLRREAPGERQNGGALATIPGWGSPAPLWFSRPSQRRGGIEIPRLRPKAATGSPWRSPRRPKRGRIAIGARRMALMPC